MSTVFNKMSMEQLIEMRKTLEAEIASRNNARRKELFSAIVDALNAYHTEFPRDNCDIYGDYVTCDECGCDTESHLNIFECIDQLEEMLRGME